MSDIRHGGGLTGMLTVNYICLKPCSVRLRQPDQPFTKRYVGESMSGWMISVETCSYGGALFKMLLNAGSQLPNLATAMGACMKASIANCVADLSKWALHVSSVPKSDVFIVAASEQAVVLLWAAGNAAHSSFMALPAFSITDLPANDLQGTLNDCSMCYKE